MNKCGCGKPVRYETADGPACNKWMRCQPVTPERGRHSAYIAWCLKVGLDPDDSGIAYMAFCAGHDAAKTQGGGDE